MKTLVFALTALLFLLASTSCQKKPTASFSTLKTEYNVGESITLSNASSDAETYSWVVVAPDGKEMRSSTREFMFVGSQQGAYEVRLGAYSQNGRHFDKSRKTINVKSNEGSVIFYTNRTGSTLSYYITDNGSSYGWFYPRASSQVPACGTSDCYTFTGNAGQQRVFTVSNTLTGTYQTYTITLAAGTCQAQAVNF